ncbi:succinate dehydrogenase, hydrophobic membrane anchor protein [Alsobacter soli]|uniref:Succinate dehydrogenase hydrophobic membrane anchor subunit n=1 Tax=Alsobacter soli TaxID=2109933 RepID=A0A2T1HW11_9HYPH|nr:succinate dehydrogenase, hydrophobic membrane anchor protein [Alsobacter soli]PSC05844.1 succinate dehydrogenase, hydrophobic membrane anchor protein [Alsobacter soli]
MSAFGKFSIQTAYKRVHGLGSAGAGTEHFWRQRVTAVALIPLTLVFVVVVILATGKDYDAARRLLGNPFVALSMLLFVGAGISHMRIGMQVIIEDYVHEDVPKIALLLLNTFFSIACGLACAYAILKLSFGG